MKPLSLFILLPMVFSCHYQNVRVIETASYQGLKEERLGVSSYNVKIPINMFLEEARGIEGQLGYGIYLIDSIHRHTSSSAFIEIEPERPIRGEEYPDQFIEKVKSGFPGGTITWKITKTETKYYIGETHRGKLSLRASSVSARGLDSMVSIVATLSTR